MTLTELKYIVALAREKHFGRAADACFVSQPTLSVAIKKLEAELNVSLFERGNVDVSTTQIGEQVVSQAQRVLEEAAVIRVIAKQGDDPLVGPLRVGVIYTVGPYLLPSLVAQMIQCYPSMPMLLQENYTVKLLELLKQGDMDCVIMALPAPDVAVSVLPLYNEAFVVAVPKLHEWAGRSAISVQELKQQTMLLLGQGHCLRDQVLEVCPELSRFSQSTEGIARTFEGSSLETIRHMVASGVGLTVLPATAVPYGGATDALLRYIPFNAPAPDRQIALVWRKSFSRVEAIFALQLAILDCNLQGAQMIETRDPQKR